MKDLIETIVKQIVVNKDEVAIKELNDNDPMGNKITYLISVAKDDIGSVIGKSGKTINSIRNIAKAKSIKENTFVNVKVSE